MSDSYGSQSQGRIYILYISKEVYVSAYISQKHNI